MLVYEDLLEWLDSTPTIQELRKKAKELGIRLKKRMKKRDILKAIRQEIERRIAQTKEETTNPTSHIENQEIQGETSNHGEDLPKSYGKDKLVLMPVNPNWLHAYWDFSPETIRKIESLGLGYEIVLRLYDVTYIIFDGTNAHRTFEFGVDVRFTRNYYFNVPLPGASYILELGYKGPDGKFVPLLRSNVCSAPRNHPSDSKRERWLDLRTKEKRVKPGGEPYVRPIEKMVGSSGVGILQNVSPSGGGAFIWEKVRSGLGKGGK